VEIDVSLIQRTVLTLHDLADLEALRLGLAWYECLSNPSPTPVSWTFDHTQLAPLLATIKAHHTRLTAAPWHSSEEAA